MKLFYGDYIQCEVADNHFVFSEAVGTLCCGWK